MGCNVSCKRSTSPESPTPTNNVRIIHLNGRIAHLDYPATVAEVTGNDNHFFLFTHAQLLSNTSKPLTPETILEAGKAYFSLPYSVFESGVSPMDLAPMAKRLASKTRKDRKSKRKHEKVSIWSSMIGLPSTDDEKENGRVGTEKSSESRSWRPSLDTIREKSFNRRSESDDFIQELFHV